MHPFQSIPGRAHAGGSEVLPFSRNGTVFLFFMSLASVRGAAHLFFSPSIILSDLGGRITFRSFNHCPGEPCDHPLSRVFHVTEANQGPDISFFFFPPPARLDPLPPAISKPLSGLTSWAWTMAGCRKIHEIRLEGVKTSAFPWTASTVNTRDTPPALEEALFPRALSPLGHGHRFQSRTLLSLSPSSRCTPPQGRL